MDPRYAAAISAIESSDNYGLLGPTTQSGDRAHGKYQVMGANIAPWSQAALGRSLTPEEFLRDPAAQDKVFEHRFGSYLDKYGNADDAASAWFTGRPLAQGAGSKDILGTSGTEYVRRFNAALNRAPPAQEEKRQTTMDQGALSASGLTGSLGALFADKGAMGGNTFGDRADKALLWLKSISHPELAAQAAAPQDNFTMMATPDGGLMGYNKKTGKYGQVMAPTPKIETIGSGPMGDIKAIRVGSKYFDPQTNALLFDSKNTGSAAPSAPGEGLPGQGVSAAGPSLIPRQYLAQGVNQFDDSKQGPERVAQYHPTIASEIMAMFNGEKMPVGKGDKYTQFITREARALGDHLGQPFSDTTFAAKRTALNDLSKVSPSSAGGQAIMGLTSLDHLGEVKKGYDEIHNRGVPTGLGWIPGSGSVAKGWNTLQNTADQYAGQAKGLATKLDRYVEESTKYYAGGQGAQTERNRIHSNFDPNLQPAASLGALKAERDLQVDKTRNGIAQLASVLGPEHPRVQELTKRLNETIGRIDEQLGFTKGPAVTLPKGVRSIQQVQ